jgi:DNA-binding TFAR19-related protein (PDSD5 family)
MHARHVQLHLRCGAGKGRAVQGGQRAHHGQQQQLRVLRPRLLQQLLQAQARWRLPAGQLVAGDEVEQRAQHLGKTAHTAHQ